MESRICSARGPQRRYQSSLASIKTPSLLSLVNPKSSSRNNRLIYDAVHPPLINSTPSREKSRDTAGAGRRIDSQTRKIGIFNSAERRNAITPGAGAGLSNFGARPSRVFNEFPRTRGPPAPLLSPAPSTDFGNARPAFFPAARPRGRCSPGNHRRRDPAAFA